MIRDDTSDSEPQDGLILSESGRFGTSVKKTRFGGSGTRAPAGSGAAIVVRHDRERRHGRLRERDALRRPGGASATVKRAAGEAGGTPSAKATRFGDLGDLRVWLRRHLVGASEMWLRRRGRRPYRAAAGPPRGASRRGALIASGPRRVGAPPPAGATF